MTVIQPNSISGITSITAQGDTINIYKSDGTTAGLNLNGVNISNTSGVSTFSSLIVTNLNASGVATFAQSNPTNLNVSGVGTVANLRGTNANLTGITTSATLTVTGVGTFGTSVGVATASPKSALDLSLKTDAIALPQGTTAQRPSGNNPYIRWNTSNNALEIYNGTDWVEIITDYFPSGSTILG